MYGFAAYSERAYSEISSAAVVAVATGGAFYSGGWVDYLTRPVVSPGEPQEAPVIVLPPLVGITDEEILALGAEEYWRPELRRQQLEQMRLGFVLSMREKALLDDEECIALMAMVQ